MTSRSRLLGVSAAALVAVVATSQLLELFINRVLRPDLDEWTWISDAFLMLALLVTTTLWIRLRLAHTVIADLEHERLVIQAELEVAAKVQRGLLPPIPEPLHGIAWHAVMEPAGHVGGDYYDFFRLGDDLMSVVDTARHTMAYANAGHPPGVIVHAGHAARALGVGGPPLGLLVGARYDEELVALGAGDLVVLVSDGISEALDAGGDRIPAVVMSELAGQQDVSPKAACARLMATARRSKGPEGVAEWADDRTVVAFSVSARSGS